MYKMFRFLSLLALIVLATSKVSAQGVGHLGESQPPNMSNNEWRLRQELLTRAPVNASENQLLQIMITERETASGAITTTSSVRPAQQVQPQPSQQIQPPQPTQQIPPQPSQQQQGQPQGLPHPTMPAGQPNISATPPALPAQIVPTGAPTVEVNQQPLAQQQHLPSPLQPSLPSLANMQQAPLQAPIQNPVQQEQAPAPVQPQQPPVPMQLQQSPVPVQQQQQQMQQQQQALIPPKQPEFVPQQQVLQQETIPLGGHPLPFAQPQALNIAAPLPFPVYQQIDVVYPKPVSVAAPVPVGSITTTQIPITVQTAPVHKFPLHGVGLPAHIGQAPQQAQVPGKLEGLLDPLGPGVLNPFQPIQSPV